MSISKVPSRDHIDALGERIASAAAYVDQATHRLLTDIRAFDQAGGWHRQGAKSCAAWLSWRIGLSPGPAREHVRVANKLGELPAIDAAMAAGELSYSKARAITRVANDDNAELLLKLARNMTAAQLERTCRLHHQMGPQDVEQETRRERNRYLRQRHTDDGMVSIELRLRPDEAAKVVKAIEAAAESKPLIDGAVALAEAALRGDKVTRSPVDVTVHVDASDLSGHTDDGTGVSAETTRRLCCDAGLTPVIEDADGKTLDIGRKTRTVPAAIRRALDLRDSGCQFPGCNHTRFVDAHHVEHWANGGKTALSNLVLLCSHHHKHVHELGFEVRAEQDGTFAFFRPNGRRIEAAGDRVRKPIAPSLPQGLVTPKPGGDGMRPDYDYIMTVLWQAEHPPVNTWRR